MPMTPRSVQKPPYVELQARLKLMAGWWRRTPFIPSLVGERECLGQKFSLKAAALLLKVELKVIYFGGRLSGGCSASQNMNLDKRHSLSLK